MSPEIARKVIKNNARYAAWASRSPRASTWTGFSRSAALKDLDTKEAEIQKLAQRLQFRVDTHMLEFAGRCAK